MIVINSNRLYRQAWQRTDRPCQPPLTAKVVINLSKINEKKGFRSKGDILFIYSHPILLIISTVHMYINFVWRVDILTIVLLVILIAPWGKCLQFSQIIQLIHLYQGSNFYLFIFFYLFSRCFVLLLLL